MFTLATTTNNITIIAHNTFGTALIFTLTGISRTAHIAVELFDIVRSLGIHSLFPHNWLGELIIKVLRFVGRLERRRHWESELLKRFSSLLEYYLLRRVYIAIF